MIGKFSAGFSKVWKIFPIFFQTLENFGSIFPNLGKNRGGSSKGWKNRGKCSEGLRRKPLFEVLETLLQLGHFLLQAR